MNGMFVWRAVHSLSLRLEANASRLEAMTIRLASLSLGLISVSLRALIQGKDSSAPWRQRRRGVVSVSPSKSKCRPSLERER